MSECLENKEFAGWKAAKRRSRRTLHVTGLMRSHIFFLRNALPRAGISFPSGEREMDALR